MDSIPFKNSQNMRKNSEKMSKNSEEMYRKCPSFVLLIALSGGAYEEFVGDTPVNGNHTPVNGNHTPANGNYTPVSGNYTPVFRNYKQGTMTSSSKEPDTKASFFL